MINKDKAILLVVAPIFFGTIAIASVPILLGQTADKMVNKMFK